MGSAPLHTPRCVHLPVLNRLELIGTAQAAGFKLKEIRDLFVGFPAHTSASQRWQTLAEAKIPEIESLLSRVQRMKGWLELLAHCNCSDLDDCAAAIRRSSEAIEEGQALDPKGTRSTRTA